MRRILLASLVLGMTWFPQVSKAESATTNCFDNYTFNSVQADLSPTLSSTVPGVPLTFKGTLKNANPYPVVDGSVFVKIFRTDTAAGKVQRNGYPVVDSFFAKDGIVIPANGNIPFSFDWNVPRYLPSGEYEAAFYYIVGKRFNLLGLSFTDDVTGNTVPFSVKGDAPEVPAFDKNAVTLNSALYAFADFPPHFRKDEPVDVVTKLVNPSTESRTETVVWTLSNWSAESGSVLDQKTETVTLAPKETKSLKYSADPAKSIGSVTFLKAEAKYQDTASILDIRFVRDGYDEVRLNFPGLMKYPVKAGEQNTLFSCLHSTNADNVTGGELTLTLTDASGTVLDTSSYKGDITSAMMGVKHDFTPGVTSFSFTLKAELKKDGRTVETYETSYRCEDIDASLCPSKNAAASVIDTVKGSFLGQAKTVLLALFILIPLCLLLWFVLRRRRGLRVLLFLLLGSLSFAPNGARAASVVWNTKDIPRLWQSRPQSQHEKDCLGYVLFNTNVSVQYHADLSNATTGVAILSGDSVKVGDRIRVSIPHTPTDTSWFGTGGTFDSPYGFWGKNVPTDSTTDYCNADMKYTGLFGLADSMNDDMASLNNDLMMSPQEFSNALSEQYVVDVPKKTISNNGTATLSCEKMVFDAANAQNETVCTVTGAGALTMDIRFAPVASRFYFRNNGSPMVSGEPVFVDGGRVASHPSAPYTLTVPESNIEFNLSVVSEAGDNAPTTPTVTGPIIGTPSSSYAFSARSTDPDGDTLRYGFDWNNDGSVDQWVPSSDYVASGTWQSGNYSWISTGSKTFQVLAEDSRGKLSGWTPHSITISLISSSSLTLCNVDGSGSESPANNFTLYVGESRQLKAHYGRADSCKGRDVTFETVFSGTNAAIDVTSVRPGNATGSVTGKANGEGTITATDSVQKSSDKATVLVSAFCDSHCAENAKTVCQGKTFIGSCGETCTGTRNCNQNWIEVAPTAN